MEARTAAHGAANAQVSPSRRSLLAVELVAALLGAAGLIVEIAIVRASAPWFGQGTHVWANAIGVVLLALALGSALGGRWAERDPRGVAVPLALAGAALLLAAAARLVAPLSAWLAPVDVAGDRPLPVSFWGSLAVTAALAGPAVVVLGAVPPVLVRFLRRDAGRAAAVVSAAGTVGGLLACAATTTAIVPVMGSRGAIAVAALLTAAAALGAALRRRSPETEDAAATDRSVSARVGVATRAPILAAAGLVGFAALVLEFVAFRALTPLWGATNHTYALVIGILLFGLATGNAIGGRARGTAADRSVVRAFLVVAAVGAVVAPAIVAAAAATPVRATGGLGAFLLAAVALGTVCPVLVRRHARAVGAGRAAGEVFGVATAACLLACYATPLLLLPDLGVRWTSMGVAGGAALLAAVFASQALRPGSGSERPSTTPEPEPVPVVAAAATRARPSWVAAALATAGAAVAAFAPWGPLREDTGQLVEIETAYQTVRVVEGVELMRTPGTYPPLYSETAREARTRFLRFDEDASSYQSVRLLDGESELLTGGRYYDHLALGAWFDGMPWTAPAGDPRVLVVGYCGGTLHRVLSLVAPPGRRGPDVVGVELDPAVTRLARERLGEPPAPSPLLITGEDGRRVVEDLAAAEPFHLVLVDAYQRTQYVPFQLTTREFFEACARRLTPQGAIGVNVNAPGGLAGELLRAVEATMAAALGSGHVWVVGNLEYPTNFVVWGTKDGRPPRLGAGVPESLAAPVFTLERFLVRADETGLVLTDDRAPVERLADRDLLPVDVGR